MKSTHLKKLPDSWIWTKIGNIGTISSGGTPSTKVSDNFKGSIPWITPADLSGYKDKYITRGKRNLRKYFERNR